MTEVTQMDLRKGMPTMTSEKGWKTGDADEFLEDIMTEHVCVWKPDIYEKAYLGARCDCGETMSEVDVTARLNATERLSAKVARRNGVILRLGADRVSYGKQTQGYGDSIDLMAYANILEGKDET